MIRPISYWNLPLRLITKNPPFLLPINFISAKSPLFAVKIYFYIKHEALSPFFGPNFGCSLSSSWNWLSKKPNQVNSYSILNRINISSVYLGINFVISCLGRIDRQVKLWTWSWYNYWLAADAHRLKVQLATFHCIVHMEHLNSFARTAISKLSIEVKPRQQNPFPRLCKEYCVPFRAAQR